jgi:formyltetrahydrofolate-dependent phosphoribosylglycinamide formyltransferase
MYNVCITPANKLYAKALFMIDNTLSAPLRIAVLFSGPSRGSNLQALLDACAAGEIAGRVALVIGTRVDAPALESARAADTAAVVVSPRKYENDEAGYAEALLRQLRRYDIDLICLTGYMRKLPPPVIAAFPMRVMNVHPALLPLFGGRGMFGEHVHRAVLESGMKVAGCTVHFVDEQYDTGPIIVQFAVPVLDDDTPQTLAARILPEEHRAFVQAVRLYAQGRLRISGRRVTIVPSTPPITQQVESEV